MKGKSLLSVGLIVLLIVVFGFLAAVGIGQEKRLSIYNIKQGLDLKGGVTVTFEADTENPTVEEMNTAVALIRERLDRRNYMEAEVAIENENRIRVDMPGVEDVEQAVEEIGQTAQLLFVSEEGEVLLTGAHVKSAKKETNTTPTGATQIVVSLEFSDEGRQLFAEATTNNQGKIIYILLDNEVKSNPRVDEPITGGNAFISGNFSLDEAEELAALIRAGALPFNLDVIYMNNVGAKLGANALESSIYAGVIGVGIILLFMVVAYRMLGISADIALLFYVALMLLMLSLLGITLTLPGIAGIILSIGMAVDANVVIFERIKEELRNGKTLRVAVDTGFSRAFPAILDGNVTTLIAAVVLFLMGTGPIKGFAQTLGIGVVISMFTAIVVTKLLVKGFLGMGFKNPKIYCVK